MTAVPTLEQFPGVATSGLSDNDAIGPQADPPYNPAARQISIGQAQTLHIWGLKVGDLTSLNDRF
jgi:hypothetical protein